MLGRKQLTAECGAVVQRNEAAGHLEVLKLESA